MFRSASRTSCHLIAGLHERSWFSRALHNNHISCANDVFYRLKNRDGGRDGDNRA